MRLRVFKLFTLSIFVILIFLTQVHAAPGDVAPDFTLTDIDGNTFSLSDFRDHVVILEFFATYCGSCIDEIPHLQAVENEPWFGQGCVILSLSIWDQDTNARLRQFRDDYDITWRLAMDTTNVRGAYDVSALPTLFLIDRDGFIQHEHIDEIVSGSILKAEVGNLLADINDDGSVDVLDLTRVSLSYGTFNGDAGYDRDADPTSDGIVDMKDLALVARYLG